MVTQDPFCSLVLRYFAIVTVRDVNLAVTNREVRELWETQDFQVRPVSAEDLVRG